MNRTVPVVANIKEGESVSVVCYASGTPTPSYFWKFLKNIPGKFLTRYLERKCFRDGFGRFHRRHFQGRLQGYDHRIAWENAIKSKTKEVQLTVACEQRTHFRSSLIRGSNEIIELWLFWRLYLPLHDGRLLGNFVPERYFNHVITLPFGNGLSADCRGLCFIIEGQFRHRSKEIKHAFVVISVLSEYLIRKLKGISN